MQKIKRVFNIKKIVILFLFMTLLTSAYAYFYNYIYSQMDIELVENVSVSYGAKNVEVEDFIKNTNGEINDVFSSIDSNTLGKQKVMLELKKMSVTKKFAFYVDIVDSIAPTIEIKESEINITEGDEYNILDNISSVTDNVDTIGYLENTQDNNTGYYNLNTNFNKDIPGEYSVEVVATDKSGNKSTSAFKVNVAEKPRTIFKEIIQNSAGPNSKGSSIVDSATALIGSPYVSGGTSPSGFDCSGFVQYVYKINGISVSRSANTQVRDGVSVSYSDAQPGDILIWGYPNGTITHAAIYIGNDTMIHAANPSQGVLRSNVSAWTRGSDVQVLDTRRIVS